MGYAALRGFVAYYDNKRYHEPLNNVTRADAYFGRKYEVVSERKKMKQHTMRKREYLAAMAAQAEAKNRLVAEAISSPKSLDDAHTAESESAFVTGSRSKNCRLASIAEALGCPAQEVSYMLEQVALGCLLVVITTAVHAVCTAGVIRALRFTRADRWNDESSVKRVLVLSLLVLALFLAALLEVNIWAVAYLVVGAIPDLEPALYFSTVTFTTLGYGDITLDANWRLLASFQAANGTIMFGWTTALVFAVLQRMIADVSAAREAAP